MARSVKRSGKKRRAKIHFKANTIKNKRKREKKARHFTTCPQVDAAWEQRQGAQSNMQNMGLAYDVNKVLKVPSLKEQLKQQAKGDVVMKDASSENVQKKTAKKSDTAKKPEKVQVVESIEAEAAVETNARKKQQRLSQPEIRYCIYMMEKYGDDFEGMAKDYKNIDQDTPAQIRHKIQTFKSIPVQYNAYLRSKGMIAENGHANNDSAMEVN